MIRPLRAPVRPRFVSSATGDALPLDEAIESLSQSISRGAIEILGDQGTGKTTALEHLAATLTCGAHLRLLDEPEPAEVGVQAACCLVVFTAKQHLAAVADVSLPLAPWTDDEVIEYLLHAHPHQCAAVMQRFRNDDFRKNVGGSPQLWRMILDEMAADASLSDTRGALRRGVARRIENRDVQRGAARLAIASLLRPVETGKISEIMHLRLKSLRSFREVMSLVRHRAVQLLLAADQLVESLKTRPEQELPVGRLPHDLVHEASQVAMADRKAIRRLKKLLRGENRSLQPIAASILTEARVRWRPTPQAFLLGALLRGVKWKGVDLSGACLSQACLDRADLSKACLKETDLARARLRRARLCGANAEKAQLVLADLTGSDLSRLNAPFACFRRAKLVEACLDGAALATADLRRAVLTAARFQGTDLLGADLRGAEIEDADFRGANLRGSCLEELPLRKACILGADFGGARLTGCDLECVELPNAKFAGADLSGASLTGSRMPGANFSKAQLCQAGVADVAWEGADLRDANLSGCSFHMGSSRSGLVGSPYPCHGSRTGFYTDAYDDRYHKPPEEIRKANLCNADLRGARIDDTDFYLVDLRGAKYDAEQAEHFRRCNAIL